MIPKDSPDIRFEEFFNLDEIQRLQDDFSAATGVASVITYADGTRITRPSNFCRLCSDIIRKSERGYANCCRSDEAFGKFCPDGPIVQPCPNGGLWKAGAGIAVGGRHIANWFIGQVRDESLINERIFEYAKEIGADEQSFLDAFKEVPAMPRKQFNKIAQALHTLASQLSFFANQNTRQARLIEERKLIEKKIWESEEKFRFMTENSADVIWHADLEYRFDYISPSWERMTGFAQQKTIGKPVWGLHRPEVAEFIKQRKAKRFQDEQDGIRTSAIRYELEQLCKDGSWIWTEVNAVPHHNQQGELIGLHGITRDISDRKRLEKEVQLHAGNLEAKVEQRTQELFAANQELAAMNEEVSAMNELLENANRSLATEVAIRQQKEQEVLKREKQYRASTSLLTNPSEDINGLLESILHDAVQLVGAPGGHITLLDKSGRKFVFCHVFGINNEEYMNAQPVEQGMLGEAYQSGELLLVEDYRMYPKRIEKDLLSNFTTGLMMPLKIGGKVTGILTANWQNEVHPVTAEDVDIFRQYGVLASIALERAHAGRQIGHHNFLLQKLAETTTSLVNELDVDKSLQNILNQATNFMGIPHGFIQLFESDGNQALYKFGSGRYEDFVGKRILFNDKGIVAEVKRTGKMVVVDDYVNWPHRIHNALGDEITSAMQAPLNLDGKTIGSIGLTIFGEALEIDREKVAVFEQFATVATIAFKNAMAHQKICYQAFHDALTGLPNRAHLNKRLEEEMILTRSGQAAGAVMFIDLDDLKTVNDLFGHTCGDSVIVAAAEDIVGALGEEAFVARVGGDEFVVMLSGEEDPSSIAQIAERLVGAIRREYEVKGQRIHMSTSIGVTLYPGDADMAEETLKNADIAMYAAKTAGKNCWRFYEQGMLKETYEKMVLTNCLRHSLENGELYLHYQPLISLEKRHVVGYEALLRWNSLEQGQVPPLRFIPLAEESGLILSIGEWVIGEACRFARRLADLGRRNIRVSVNVSPRQMAAENFVKMVRQCINDAGIEPEQLEVEITENVLIESLEDSTRKLVELSALGVRLSLDDFGTGFSSLTYLRSLPVGTLKIDKSFIDRILEDRVQEGFIRSIIDMAHVLGLNVVAEGVETEAQLAKLVQFDCDSVQGYVFSTPVSQEEAIRFSL